VSANLPEAIIDGVVLPDSTVALLPVLVKLELHPVRVLIYQAMTFVIRAVPNHG
jgi:hypothetical protein